MSDPYWAKYHLLQGLVGPHERLYRESVSFKVAIDTFSQMLPFMIDGLAEEAQKQDKASIERYMDRMLKPVSFDPSLICVNEPSMVDVIREATAQAIKTPLKQSPPVVHPSKVTSWRNQ